VLSIRNQDAILKVAYQNGSGDGHIVWRLGSHGRFGMVNNLGVPIPWFSHQHDVEVLSDRPLTFSSFDNGNTRYASDSSAKSRAQVLTVGEAGNSAALTFNYNLPVYSHAFGSVQSLVNGNWGGLAGHIEDKAGTYFSQGYEVTPAGTLVYKLQYQEPGYRSWRLAGIAPFAPAVP
jgi:hypothetical protein